MMADGRTQTAEFPFGMSVHQPVPNLLIFGMACRAGRVIVSV
jgi:hypothetical protein